MEQRHVKPLLTWVGGKVRTAAHLLPLMPQTFNAYHEPFCGSASTLLAMNLIGKRVYLNDMNVSVHALFDVLKTVSGAQALNRRLAEYQREYDATCKASGREGGRRMFDAVRASFNRLKFDASRYAHRVELAAKLTFLNRTAYGSLYRENADGMMTSTYGPSHQRLHVLIHRPQVVDALQAYLSRNRVSVTCKDFSVALRLAKKRDFVFMDPPYLPSKTQGFVSYHQQSFNADAHLRVLHTLDQLTRKGCHVMILNSDTEEVRAMYRDYNLTTITVPAGIAGKTRRDLVITNY